MMASLRAGLDWRVLAGFGGSMRAASRYVAPRDEGELRAVLTRACAEGLPVALRGAGRSYGDAALNSRGIVVDMSRMDRLLAWDPIGGVATAEPGLTIEGLWRRTIEDGFWPPVVPGTMFPTLGGCLAMNVHGKNNWRVGPFGEHVVDFELLTPRGESVTCSRDANADLFHAAIGGLGLLGAIVRVRLRLKRVESGCLRVRPFVEPTLDAVFDRFERETADADYVVGWLDALAPGGALGRGVIHRADYLAEDEDPSGRASLHVERQGLPASLLGVPRSAMWRIMRPLVTRPGIRFLNALKYYAARIGAGAAYLQSHVAFAFLLDYVPDWRRAYGDGGLIQVQVFLPKDAARQTLREVLRACADADAPPFLAVLKRHRPDAFLLSHALDGWSLAMDFPVRDEGRERVWAIAADIAERTLAVGGRFYFAKDAALSREQVLRAYGAEPLAQLFALKSRVDPDGVLSSDLSRRAFGS